MEHVENYEPRQQNPPLSQTAATVGYVAAGAPLLAVTSLRGADSVDDTTVKFLLRAELKKKEEAVEEKHERRMLTLNHRVGEDLPLTDAEWSAWSKWATSSSSSAGKERKGKKRKKRRLLRTSCSSRAARTWKPGRSTTSSLSSWPCSVSAGCLRRPLCDAWPYCGHMLMRQSWWLSTILTVSTCLAATSSVLGCLRSTGVLGFWGLLDSGYMRCVSLAALFALGSGRYFYALLFLTVKLPVLVSPEEYECAVFLRDDFRICRIQRFLVRQWLLVSVYGGREVLHVFLRKGGLRWQSTEACGRIQRAGELVSMVSLDEFHAFSL